MPTADNGHYVNITKPLPQKFGRVVFDNLNLDI